MSLRGIEIKVLKKINDTGYTSKTQIVAFLHNTLGMDTRTANKVYALWLLNYREDGDYKQVTEINRDTNPILTFLNKMVEEPEEFDQSDIPDKFYDKIQACKKTYD